MRRIFLVLAVAALMVAVGATSALADAAPNDHTCNGQYFTDRAPAFEQNGLQAERATAQAHEGIRADVVRANTSFRANCGDNGVPGGF